MLLLLVLALVAMASAQNMTTPVYDWVSSTGTAYYGASVAVAGDTVVVGNWEAAAVMVLTCTTAGCSSAGTITAPSGSMEYGSSVAISDSLIAVGDEAQSKVYVYNCSSFPCTQYGVTLSGSYLFGSCVAIKDGLLIVYDAWHIYAYDCSSGTGCTEITNGAPVAFGSGTANQGNSFIAESNIYNGVVATAVGCTAQDSGILGWVVAGCNVQLVSCTTGTGSKCQSLTGQAKIDNFQLGFAFAITDGYLAVSYTSLLVYGWTTTNGITTTSPLQTVSVSSPLAAWVPNLPVGNLLLISDANIGSAVYVYNCTSTAGSATPCANSALATIPVPSSFGSSSAFGTLGTNTNDVLFVVGAEYANNLNGAFAVYGAGCPPGAIDNTVLPFANLGTTRVTASCSLPYGDVYGTTPSGDCTPAGTWVVTSACQLVCAAGAYANTTFGSQLLSGQSSAGSCNAPFYQFGATAPSGSCNNGVMSVSTPCLLGCAAGTFSNTVFATVTETGSSLGGTCSSPYADQFGTTPSGYCDGTGTWVVTNACQQPCQAGTYSNTTFGTELQPSQGATGSCSAPYYQFGGTAPSGTCSNGTMAVSNPCLLGCAAGTVSHTVLSITMQAGSSLAGTCSSPYGDVYDTTPSGYCNLAGTWVVSNACEQFCDAGTYYNTTFGSQLLSGQEGAGSCAAPYYQFGGTAPSGSCSNGVMSVANPCLLGCAAGTVSHTVLSITTQTGSSLDGTCDSPYGDVYGSTPSGYCNVAGTWVVTNACQQFCDAGTYYNTTFGSQLLSGQEGAGSCAAPYYQFGGTAPSGSCSNGVMSVANPCLLGCAAGTVSHTVLSITTQTGSSLDGTCDSPYGDAYGSTPSGYCNVAGTWVVTNACQQFCDAGTYYNTTFGSQLLSGQEGAGSCTTPYYQFGGTAPSGSCSSGVLSVSNPCLLGCAAGTYSNTVLSNTTQAGSSLGGSCQSPYGDVYGTTPSGYCNVVGTWVITNACQQFCAAGTYSSTVFSSSLLSGQTASGACQSPDVQVGGTAPSGTCTNGVMGVTNPCLAGCAAGTYDHTVFAANTQSGSSLSGTCNSPYANVYGTTPSGYCNSTGSWVVTDACQLFCAAATYSNTTFSSQLLSGQGGTGSCTAPYYQFGGTAPSGTCTDGVMSVANPCLLGCAAGIYSHTVLSTTTQAGSSLTGGCNLPYANLYDTTPSGYCNGAGVWVVSDACQEPCPAGMYSNTTFGSQLLSNQTSAGSCQAPYYQFGGTVPSAMCTNGSLLVSNPCLLGCAAGTISDTVISSNAQVGSSVLGGCATPFANVYETTPSGYCDSAGSWVITNACQQFCPAGQYSNTTFDAQLLSGQTANGACQSPDVQVGGTAPSGTCTNGVMSVTNPCLAGCAAGTYANSSFASNVVDGGSAEGTCVLPYVAIGGAPGATCEGAVLVVANPCEYASCPAGSNVTASWPATPVGSSATFSCSSGYYASEAADCDAVDDSAVGAWADNPCLAVYCSGSSSVNATWSQTLAGTSAAWTCNTGYYSADTSVLCVQTLGSASWGTIAAPCLPVYCQPGSALNATWAQVQAGLSGSYVCAENYYSAGATYDCVQSGASGARVDTGQPCAPIICAAETYGNAAWATTQASYTATGTCAAGYYGSPSRVCAPASGVATSDWEPSIQTPCQSCDCHVNGSTSANCSNTGVCTCLQGFTGAECGQCSLGFFGADCAPCPANTFYSAVGGNITCSPCPANSNSSEGSTSCDCVPGYSTNKDGLCESDSSTPTPTPMPWYEIWLPFVVYAVYLLVVAGTYLYLRKKTPAANNSAFVTAGLALFDCATGCVFVWEMYELGSMALFFASLVSILLAFWVNFGLVIYLIATELRSSDAVEAYLTRYSWMAAITAFLSGANFGVMSLLSSGILDHPAFKIGWDARVELKVGTLGIVGNVIEDIPQLIVQIIAAASYRGSSPISILALVATCVTLFLTLTRRLFLLLVLRFSPSAQRHRESNTLPKKASQEDTEMKEDTF